MQVSSSINIKLGKQDYTFVRPKLKKWLELEDAKGDITEAIAHWDSQKIADAIFTYIAIAYCIKDKKVLESIAWTEIVHAMLHTEQVCKLEIDFPILLAEVSSKKESWDYDGRTWYVWLHMLAKEYGWSEEHISELEIETAFGLMQEIAIGEQLKREFIWMTSEVPYQTKDGRFVPLDRPSWMQYAYKDMREVKIKIKKEFMPVGNIFSYETKDDKS